MNILLVEPAYYTQYPPLGLLKLSRLYKAQGHEIKFVRGLQLVTRFVPDEIAVTSLFTWAWRPVWEAVAFYRALFPKATLRLGGIYASLTPDHAKQSGADEVVTGLLPDVKRFPLKFGHCAEVTFPDATATAEHDGGCGPTMPFRHEAVIGQQILDHPQFNGHSAPCSSRSSAGDLVG